MLTLSLAFLTAGPAAARVIRISPGDSINTALNEAQSGDTVLMRPGVYQMPVCGCLSMKSGVTLRGQGPSGDVRDQFNEVTIRADIRDDGDLEHLVVQGVMDDVRIQFINFEDVRLVVRGNSTTQRISNVYVQRCYFYQTRNRILGESMLQILYCDLGRAQYNRLVADLPATDPTVQGITFTQAKQFSIHNNDIRGDLRKGIYLNGSGRDGTMRGFIQNGTVSENYVYRMSNSDDDDHGIYMHQYIDILVRDNFVAGWADDSSGQSLKIKDGYKARAINNEFWTSGIILRTESSNVPNGTVDTLISGNIIHQGGIDIWEPDEVVDGVLVQADERSIRVSDNVIYGTWINAVRDIDPQAFNEASSVIGTYSNGDPLVGGVHGNQTREPLRLAEGIYQTRNTTAGSDPHPTPDF